MKGQVSMDVKRKDKEETRVDEFQVFNSQRHKRERKWKASSGKSS